MSYPALTPVVFLGRWSSNRASLTRARGDFSPERDLDEQADIRVGGELQEGCRTTHFYLVDELVFREAENVHGHLTADEFDVQLDRHIPKFFNGRHAFIGESLLHERRSHALKAGHVCRDHVGDRPFNSLE